MPELTRQEEAALIVALATWQRAEEDVLDLLAAAGCTPAECAAVMRAEVN